MPWRVPLRAFRHERGTRINHPVTLPPVHPQIDLRYMFELGRSVPVIPVITKADTMTIREAQNYKQEVGASAGVACCQGERLGGEVEG